MILGVSASGRRATRDEEGRLLCGAIEELIGYASAGGFLDEIKGYHLPSWNTRNTGRPTRWPTASV